MGLTHSDVIVDSDAKCTIDATTRVITSTSPKNALGQFDHKSERVGFSMPRYIDGHDMSLTDRITVKYINGTNSGSYIVDDAALYGDSDDQISFTWLIGNNATQTIGALRFAIIFKCFDTDGNVTYAWSTKPCNIFTIFESLDSTADTVEPEFKDKLAEVQSKLQTTLDTMDQIVDDAVDDWFIENPITSDIINEVKDARTGGNGMDYTSLGEAVRGQYTELKSQINNIILTITSDGLLNIQEVDSE